MKLKKKFFFKKLIINNKFNSIAIQLYFNTVKKQGIKVFQKKRGKKSKNTWNQYFNFLGEIQNKVNL